MYMLQLFDRDDAAEPVDVRLLNDGTLRIGRDAEADWTITDPDLALSRRHCELSVGPGGLMLTALGSNGVFDEATGVRMPEATAVAVRVPGALRLGRFRLLATRAATPNLPHDGGRTMISTAPLGTSTTIASDWTEPAPAAPTVTGSLLEAFCQGAGLDASLFSSEPPEEIMRRAGAVYRQMVLGVGDLMAERDRARAKFQLTRTTIGGADNNPFKWAPSRRLAIDLLLTSSTGFLSGPAALQASFRDLKRHLVSTFAGLKGSLRAAVDRFDPSGLEPDRTSLLKSRATGQMEAVASRHADLARELDGGAAGSLDRAFVKAYDAAEHTIDTGGR